MGKHTTFIYKLLLISLLALPSFASNVLADDVLVQQIKVYNDTADLRYAYWYNSDGQKTLELQQQWDNGGWRNVFQTEWMYVDGLCTQQTGRAWSGTDWVRQYELCTTYANKQPLELQENIYANGVVAEQRKTIYTYNAQQQPATITNATWRSGAWQTDAYTTYAYAGDTVPVQVDVQGNSRCRISYTYENGLPTEQIVQTDTANGSYVNECKYHWYYEQGQVVARTVQLWQNTDAGMAWVNYQNTLCDYDVVGRLWHETYQIWHTEFWQDECQYTNTYNANGTLASRYYQEPLYRKWRDYSHIAYDYQTTPRKETATAQYDYWGGEADAPQSTLIPVVFNTADNVESKWGNRVEVLYATIESTTHNNTIEMRMPLTVYPNPSEGIFYVDTQQFRILHWRVLSLGGTLVAAHTNTERTGLIDLTHCDKGVYVLEVQTDTGIYWQKIMKL